MDMEKYGLEQLLPEEIEKKSFQMISEELQGRQFPPLEEPVIKRCIHTSADFDYADHLIFSEKAAEQAIEALRQGALIVTDTNMGKAGINQAALKKARCEVCCFMADPEVAEEARCRGETRAVISMEKAAKIVREGKRPVIFAIGNAPTALIKLYEMIIEEGLRPALIIGVPVGFVNVEAAKEMILNTEVPHIVARGRKGGSNIAAAIVNALLYQAVGRG